MQDDPVDPLGPLVDGRLGHGYRQNRVDPAAQLGSAARRVDDRSIPPQRLLQQVAHGVHPDSTVTDHSHHRHAEGQRQPVQVDTAMTGDHLVEHGQHQRGRQPESQYLGHQQQRPFQGGGVGHHEHRVGGLDLFHVTGEGPIHDLLVGTDR